MVEQAGPDVTNLERLRLVQQHAACRALLKKLGLTVFAGLASTSRRDFHSLQLIRMWYSHPWFMVCIMAGLD